MLCQPNVECTNTRAKNSYQQPARRLRTLEAQVERGLGENSGKGNAGMKQLRIFKGFGPDHPAVPVGGRGIVTALQGEADEGFRLQQAVADKADTVLAEVDGPTLLCPVFRRMVGVGDLGKMDDVILGNAGGAAAVHRQGVGMGRAAFGGSKALKMGAGRIEFCTAVGDDMFLHRQEKAIGHQQAGPVAGGPVGAASCLGFGGRGNGAGGGVGGGRMVAHGDLFAITTPICVKLFWSGPGVAGLSSVRRRRAGFDRRFSSTANTDHATQGHNASLHGKNRGQTTFLVFQTKRWSVSGFSSGQ